MTVRLSAASTDPTHDLDDVERLHWQLFRLTASYRRRDQNHMAAGRLTWSQCSMLFALRVRGPMRLGELAAFEKVTAPATTQTVRRLESLGLVRRIRDTLDHRVVRIEITAEGKAVQRMALSDLMQAMTSGLSSAEITALGDALAPLARITD